MAALSQKVIVITGGSSGIGKAMVEDALSRGAFVGVCARNYEKLTGLFPPSDKLLCFKADVSKEADCYDFIDAVLKKWSKIDVLINNAGISMRALFEDAHLDVIRELMDINFWGTVYCTKRALPAILKQKGVVVGISSIAGYRGLPGRTGYSASKFAMQGFLESLRTELLHTGANVMWVSPGFTASNIRNVARIADGSTQAETPLDESKLMTSEQCAAHVLNAVEGRKRSVVLSLQGKLAVWLSKFFPSVADKMVYSHFLKEPDSPLKKYH